MPVSSEVDAEAAPSRRDEFRVFVILAVLLAPALSIALVGGYGFFVWFTQLILGPPTG